VHAPAPAPAWRTRRALFESVDTRQLVLNTVTSVIAFRLIALLQNSARVERCVSEL
jgi:low affinity Fe/Cu permease